MEGAASHSRDVPASGQLLKRCLLAAIVAAAVVASLPIDCLAAEGPGPPVPAATEFHFVVLGDSQFDDPSTFNRTVDQVRMLRPAFVVQVGDLIGGYEDDPAIVRNQWRRFRRQIEPLGPIPFYAVAGNHDLFNAQRDVDPRLEQLFEEEWGSLYYSFRYGNALFVVLNSDSSHVQNGIDAEQLLWLSRVLEVERAAHTFVFLHRPPRFLEAGD